MASLDSLQKKSRFVSGHRFSDAENRTSPTAPLGAAMSDFAAKLTFANGKTLELAGPADITKETTEAIVNAANSSLMGGGGVDGAIHRAGGPSILEECKRIVAKIGKLPAGKAVITTGGRLPAKYVIHTVGPVYWGGRQREAETLASCYRESIRAADDHGIRSLAFPAISTGAYGYPVHEAAEAAVRAIVEALPPCAHVEQVRFVLFDISDCNTFVSAAEKISRDLLARSVIFEKGP
jgi:O-acetyl-ADP-ribose deacetylase (regulator of RNase III)